MGFVEGEGTFGYKHLVPYFQIAQNKKNLLVLNAIESYLVNIYKESVTVSRSLEGESSKNYLNEELELNYSLNKLTGVYSMTEGKIDILYYFIIPFFQSMTFFTRKSEDYYY